jgi:phosphoglycerate dehydrogenase-like enzyme
MKKFKAAFVTNARDRIDYVYTAAQQQEIAEITEFMPGIYGEDDILAGKLTETEVIFATWGMPALNAEMMDKMPKLQAVFYGAGATDAFARACFARNVKVFSAWQANAVPVAEMTVAEIILANKGYFLTSRLYSKDGQKCAKEAFTKCRGNYGETTGIIGAGMIGKLVINMLKNYNLNVLVFDPFLPDDAATALGVTKCDLPTLFEKSFVVSNHLANNAETVGMLNYELFSKMRENAVFINTGRGAQVVEADLVRILENRPDLTALLDVTYPEPPIDSHPFYTLHNCILTPHIAGSAGDEVARMGEYMLEECRAYLEGEGCRYEVSMKMLETMA